MNSIDTWERLYNMETKEIKIEVAMEIMYLINDRQLNLDDFIKDIKKIYKERGVI